MTAEFDEHPRVLALVERFREIDATMRDLPLYNAELAIEAIGFRPFADGALSGVLLTPWFMNLILLPVAPVPMDAAAIGRKERIELPAGQRSFVTGGDATIGIYQAYSLHSPVLNFTLPGQAQAEARRLLDALMTPADDDAAGSGAFDRRSMLLGRRRSTAPAEQS